MSEYLIDKDSYNFVEGTKKADFDSHTHSASDINSGTLDADRLPNVSIAKGGTGATDAETARTNLGAAAQLHTHSINDIIGAIAKFTELWENESPSSSFAGQAISIAGLSEYNLLLIYTKDSAGLWNSHFVYITDNALYAGVTVNLSNTNIQAMPAGYFECSARSVTIAPMAGTITFDEGVYGSVEDTHTWTPTADNYAQVPVLILGAKI